MAFQLIAGYAAVFDKVDNGGDIIHKGAFEHYTNRFIPLLNAHMLDCPVGQVQLLKEDDYGLQMVAHIDDTDIAPVNVGDGLSIGYYARDGYKQNQNRILTKIELIEISLVSSPLHPLARVINVEKINSINKNISFETKVAKLKEIFERS